MLPTLRDVLALPALRSVPVDVLTGDPDLAAIRWVHSSEVYEMGGLLAGGELLLTTGLGLHGRSAEQLSGYVDQLADAGCVAVALELGRSFFEAPAALVSAARRRGLVLLTWGSVVPFERIVEDFHELLIQRRTADGASVLVELVAVVQHGQGLRSLLDAVARLAGCAAEVVDLDDRVIASSSIAVPKECREPIRAGVHGATGLVGVLRLHGDPTERRRAVASQAATAVALELARGPVRIEPPSAWGALAEELLASVTLSHREVLDRMGGVGWLARPGAHVTVALAELGEAGAGEAIRRAVVEIFGTGLVATVRDHVVVLVPASGADQNRIRRLFAEVYGATGGQTGEQVRRIAVAASTDDLGALGDRLSQARDLLRVARTSGLHRGVVLAADVAVERLLSEAGSAATAQFVEQHLGPLITRDTTSTADLVRTLDAFVAAQGAKSAAAQRLGIRRQTLYSRLTRIEQILGVDLGNASHILTLAVALRAWRLRSGVDPQTAFERARGWVQLHDA